MTDIQTAGDVLQLFTPSKDGIMDFSKRIIDDVRNGNVSPLRVKAYCKTLSDIAETIDKATKSEQLTEAEKYGSKTFDLYGMEISVGAVRTEYNFHSCNDPIYERLSKMKDEISEQIKKREAFLKTVVGLVNVIDEATGEECRIAAPTKKVTDGIKTSWR